jgi:hypothetical protein
LGGEAEAGRNTGLGVEAETGRGEGSEFLERMDCSISCSFAISRVIRSLVGCGLVEATRYLLLTCGNSI